MKPLQDFELLESLFVELDPLEDGFAGVILEVHRHQQPPTQILL